MVGKKMELANAVCLFCECNIVVKSMSSGVCCLGRKPGPISYLYDLTSLCFSFSNWE